MPTRLESSRAHRLVEQICHAVKQGDAAVLDVLLDVLEAVADDTLLEELAEAMHRNTPMDP
ncbi:hypothetical protein [Kitasatospora sp. NPDC057223]|uniref:hypothetical protein n=1 Tax=Kitasatospora sp. NPDC057223 TaxID=3346055 RepID=UPI003629F9BC